jgi:hypothetical protein
MSEPASEQIPRRLARLVQPQSPWRAGPSLVVWWRCRERGRSRARRSGAAASCAVQIVKSTSEPSCLGSSRGLHCTLGFNLGMLCITKVTLPQYQAARCTVSHFIRDTPVVWYSDPCTLYYKIQQGFRLSKTRFVRALKPASSRSQCCAVKVISPLLV